MALYDNKFWLLSHIRNSFISTDDTGMCELVMSGENKCIKQHISSQEPYPEPQESEDDDEDNFDFLDFQTESDYGIRQRSNTALLIERQEKNKAPKMRHVKWENATPGENIDDMFVKKDVTKLEKKEKPSSLLSTLMKNYSNLPKNPYVEYAKFDGSGQVNIPTKKYKIYLTILPQEQRNYPMHVCCIATAKVQDLIGLILLKHTTTQDHPSNLKPVAQYGLYITEEDGEVDRDFPCLDPKEPISKFGFPCLGLVEHKENQKSVNFHEDSQPLLNEFGKIKPFVI